MNNILISSAGRRVSLLKAFQKEMKVFEENGKVFCSDSHPMLSSACQLADSYFKVPLLTDETFIDELLDKSIKNNIKIIIPTIDTELKLLSMNKVKFLEHRINIIISSEKLIEEASSKLLTKNIFNRYNFQYPKIYDKKRPSFPLISKPEFGSSGKNITIINSVENLSNEFISNPNFIFFEFLNPQKYTEFTVDLYYDRNSNLKCAVPRERIEIRGGEVSKSITRRNKLYELLKTKMLHLDGAVGCITFQFFVSKQDYNNIYGIECNPRFGGGYPLSYLAGANFPNWIIKEYLFDREIPFFEEWENNLLMLRYDEEVLVHGFEG